MILIKSFLQKLKSFVVISLSLILKGYFIALVISLVSLFIYATILVNTNIQENTIKPVVITITAISILIGSSISSLKIKKNGIVNGLCVGGIYLLSLYVLSSIAITGFCVNVGAIVMIGVGVLVGGIGGVIGVNLSH